MKIRSTSINVWALLIAIPLGLLGVTKFVSSMAQEPSQEKAGPTIWKVKKVGTKSMRIKAKGPEEVESDRIIEDQMPPRVPLDVEIKNLKTNSLLRDIEIKVTNTATKPIYFLELGIVLPDNLSPAGYPIGFPLRYGRDELIKLENPLKPGDVPLQPGASFILKIPERNLEGFEKLLAKGKITQGEVKRVYLMFRSLNFGDKTGFSSDGSAVPNTRKERSANDCYERRVLDAVQSSNSSDGPFSDVLSEVSLHVESSIPSQAMRHITPAGTGRGRRANLSARGSLVLWLNSQGYRRTLVIRVLSNIAMRGKNFLLT